MLKFSASIGTVAALLALVGCAGPGSGPAPLPQPPQAIQSEAGPAGSTYSLTDGSGGSRCPGVSLESVLASSDLALSGTVTRLDDDSVTLAVDHVYRGHATMTQLAVKRGPGVADSYRSSSVWVKGQRELVAARGGSVIECLGGATGPWNQGTASTYKAVLG